MCELEAAAYFRKSVVFWAFLLSSLNGIAKNPAKYNLPIIS
jgi:hypothetical protein